MITDYIARKFGGEFNNTSQITAFEAPYCWTSVMDGADVRFVDLLDIYASTKHVWAPP